MRSSVFPDKPPGQLQRELYTKTIRDEHPFARHSFDDGLRKLYIKKIMKNILL